MQKAVALLASTARFRGRKRWLRPRRQSHLFSGLLRLRSKNNCEEDCYDEMPDVRPAIRWAISAAVVAAERAEKGATRRMYRA